MTAKKIRILNVIFDNNIAGHEIPAFRGAVANKVGHDNVLFHNHVGDDKFRYSYPLIQYKQIQGKPSIICVDEGVDEIHKFFENRNWSIELSGRELDMKIYKLNMNQYTMQVWDKLWTYNIYNWVALNQENYKKYELCEGIADKYIFLENILKGNILSFAKGIAWTVDKDIVVKISDMIRTKTTNIKQQRILTFDIEFKSNVFLPNNIGLGKNVSLGFGNVRSLRTE